MLSLSVARRAVIASKFVPGLLRVYTWKYASVLDLYLPCFFSFFVQEEDAEGWEEALPPHRPACFARHRRRAVARCMRSAPRYASKVTGGPEKPGCVLGCGCGFGVAVVVVVVFRCFAGCALL